MAALSECVQLGRVLRLCIKLKETKKHFTTPKKHGKPIWMPEIVPLIAQVGFVIFKGTVSGLAVD